MTIAQQLKIKDFPFEIRDNNGRIIYWENSAGFWRKREYNANGNSIYYENSNADWYKLEYDANGKKIYDANGKKIYYEDSLGQIVDNRPKPVELTMQEIADNFGIDINLLIIKP